MKIKKFYFRISKVKQGILNIEISINTGYYKYYLNIILYFAIIKVHIFDTDENYVLYRDALYSWKVIVQLSVIYVKLFTLIVKKWKHQVDECFDNDQNVDAFM